MLPRLPAMPLGRGRLALLCLAALRLQAVSAKCYYPDGTSANDTPCTDETDESACCGTGYVCFGTVSQFFLCRPSESIHKANPYISDYVRGSCTDQTWRSSNCPSVCVQEDRDNLGGGNGLEKCPSSDVDFYCVSDGVGEANCSTNYQLVVFGDEPKVLTTIGVAGSSSTTKTSTSTTTSSTTSATAASTTTGSSSSSTTGTATQTAATATSTGSSGGGTNKVAIGVGVGVGVSGGLAVLGLVAWLAVRHRNKKREGDAAAAAAAAGYSPGAGAPTSMATAPTGYAPTPNLGGYAAMSPAASPSPHPAASELYDAPPSAKKETATLYTSSPPPQQPTVVEMPETPAAERYEMA